MRQSAEADFRGWVSDQRPRLRRTAFLLCGDWYLADDLVQDACTRMFSVWDRVTGTGSPDAYARRVVVNLYLDHRRRPARREELVEAVPETAEAASAEPLEQSDVVVDALRDLAPGQRAVLVLRYWEDLTVEETAHVLGTSPGNVKAQSSRAIASLRAALTARGLHAVADAMKEPS